MTALPVDSSPDKLLVLNSSFSYSILFYSCHSCLNREAFSHIFTQRNFYTEKLLHAQNFYQKSFTHREVKRLHRSFYTQNLLHTAPFTQRSFYTKTLLRTARFHTTSSYTQQAFTQQAFAHSKLLPCKLLHTASFYTASYCAASFYTASFCTQQAFTHQAFAYRKLLHREAFTHSSFDTASFYAERLLHSKLKTESRHQSNRKDGFETLFTRTFQEKITSKYCIIIIAALMQPLQLDLDAQLQKTLVSIMHAATPARSIDAATPL